jgi:L-ribulokinase
MFAATAAGIYPKVEDAQKAMTSGFAKEYIPGKENAGRYGELYERYAKLGKATEELTKPII